MARVEAERYQPFTLLLGSGQQDVGDLGLVSQSAGVWLCPARAAGPLCRWCLWAFPGLSPQMTTSDRVIFHDPFPSSPSALSNTLAATRAFRDGYLESGSVVLDAISLAAGGKNMPGLQDHTAPCSLPARPTGAGIAFARLCQPVLGTALGLLWAWQRPRDVVRWAVVVAGVAGWDGMVLEVCSHLSDAVRPPAQHQRFCDTPPPQPNPKDAVTLMAL